jgi:membrane protein implicated in regulation of membrane protease activity
LLIGRFFTVMGILSTIYIGFHWLNDAPMFGIDLLSLLGLSLVIIWGGWEFSKRGEKEREARWAEFERKEDE